MDINPLIVEAYPDRNILIIAARDRQVSRSSDCITGQRFVVCGWWNLDEVIDKPDDIDYYDIVVILNKERIHETYHTRFDQVVSRCKQYTPKIS